MKLEISILVVCFVIASTLGISQDLNLSKVDNLSSFEYKFDSLNYYYSFIQFNYDDNNFGVAQYSYYGPDSLQGHAEYMTLAPYKNGQILRKGIGYELYESGTFIAIKNFDWQGNKHGNLLRFYPDGAIKLNEKWDRGKLIKSWTYSHSGQLIEYREYDK